MKAHISELLYFAFLSIHFSECCFSSGKNMRMGLASFPAVSWLWPCQTAAGTSQWRTSAKIQGRMSDYQTSQIKSPQQICPENCEMWIQEEIRRKGRRKWRTAHWVQHNYTSGHRFLCLKKWLTVFSKHKASGF